MADAVEAGGQDMDQEAADAALRRAGKGGVALGEVVTRNADDFARDLAPVIAPIRAEGHTTLRAIAKELDARGMLTRRGGRWQVSNVRNLLARVDLRPALQIE